jgi:hypothetical protein
MIGWTCGPTEYKYVLVSITPLRSVACELAAECRDSTVRHWKTLAACYVYMCC